MIIFQLNFLWGVSIEIGSEYFSDSALLGINKYKDLINCPKRYVLSGRTGLHLIAEELKTKLGIFQILLPDYCCGSMIYPFIHQGIDVYFYDAFRLETVLLDDSIKAVLIMDYFGFISEDTLSFAQRCKQERKVVIVDATQTAFSFSPSYNIADYLIVSYRKWFDSLCCVVYSKDDFVTREYSDRHNDFNNIWRQAASLKEKYIRSGDGDKQEFLSLYAEANRLLESEYKGYSASKEEILLFQGVDSSALRNKRRQNAEILISGITQLSELYDIQLIFSFINKEDCPLFVPVLVREDKRNIIRSDLSKHNIYCPCHWPIDYKYPSKEHSYHKKEISLICDQRYDSDDMRMQLRVLMSVIKSAYKN